MTDRPSTPEVLRDWARAPVPVEEGDATDERRARVVSHLARTIRETNRERERADRHRRVGALLALAAALVLLVGGLWRGLGARHAPAHASVRPSSAGVLVTRGSESRVPALGAEQALVPGDTVSTVADARASLRLASGVEAAVASSTRVTFSRATSGDEELELGIGEISLRVPALGERGRFQVRTPDALVVVHGTAFVVRVTKRAEGEGTFTEVSVSEGKVSVERNGAQTFLTPGQSWSSQASEQKATLLAPPPAPDEPVPPAPAAAPGPAPEPKKPTGTPPAKPAEVAAHDPSALAEQNRLFSAAAAARRSGDDRTSLGHLNQLLARYPGSPLAPEARVERFRALKRLGQHAEAAREARRYLLDRQSGAASDEARSVALEPNGK